MTSQRVASLRRLLPPTLVTYYQNPLVMVRGEMQYLWDDKGRKYLDMFGGIEKLTNKLPSHLQVCFFTNSGSEANDLAIALARLHTGRFDMLGLRNGYHGMTQAVMGVTSLGTWKHPFPTGFGVQKVMCPDPYRGPFGSARCRDSPTLTVLHPNSKECDCPTNGECAAAGHYLSDLEDTLVYDFPKSSGPAAFIAEPIQGVGGAVQYPRGYLKRAFEMVKQRGGVCISDEVQTGFGRLGSHFWGFESQGAVPDIVTLAKGIANGFPMGGVVTTCEIAESLGKSLYFNTFGGNPLACTAAKAVLEVIDQEGLQENARLMGDILSNELLKIESKLVGDIRGKGLMIGLELVDNVAADHATRPPPLAPAKMSRVFERVREMGVLVGKGGLHGNVIRLKPPLCITHRDVEHCVESIAKALEAEEHADV